MSPEPRRRVLIVEPDCDGHHAFWLVLLVEAHRRAGWAVSVLGAAGDERVAAQAGLRGYSWSGVAWIQAVAPGRGGRDLVAQAASVAAERGVERVFFAFLDNVWGGLTTLAGEGRAALAGKVSGVWFHPYALDAAWRWAPPLGKRWKERGRLHRFWATGAAAGLFASVYFLVEEGAERLREVSPAVRSHVLADPYEREPRLDREAAREWLGIGAGRMVFLHIGSPERRKGLPDVIEAFGRLAREAVAGATAQGRPLLLRVGRNDRLGAGERAALDALVEGGWATTVERHVPAEELMEYFAASDWVLIPYRKFRYSSGILANAAGAGRPVIASGYGYIGRTVEAEKLGLVYRHGSARALAEALGEASRSGGAEQVSFTIRAESRAARAPEMFVRRMSEWLLPSPT
ncbi:MAG: glycosyltransferase [Opitutaceae bacterium]|jgi:glycosyltransferase involved in cell wall biosynthesis|nr:glycosyltransferase [Opitutaceae bacterium]